MEIMKEKVCRICMQEGPKEDDPLISPCSCKGSVQYMHLSCLREWIRVRQQPSDVDKAGNGFEYRPLKCDLCKGSYASGVRHCGDCASEEPLLDMPCVKPPFVVLDVPGRYCEGGLRRSCVLSFGENGDKELRLGRADDCDLRILDASVSRWHASIRLSQDGVVLEDNASKFGTLVEVQGPVPIDSFIAMSLQVGRTVFRFGSPEACEHAEGMQEP